MLEEVIWLPAWSRDAGRWHAPVRRGEFLLATLAFLAVFYLSVIDSLRGGTNSPGLYLTAGFAVVMILNILLPHLGATIAQRRYAPGLATAVLLVLPTATNLLLTLLQNTETRAGSFAVGTVAALLGALVLWSRLFRAGRWLLDKIS